MALIIRVNGSQQMIPKPSIQDLQEAVAGWVDTIRMPFTGKLMAVNEEGRLHRLPLNVSASTIALKEIVGDVVLCESTEIQY